MPPSNRRITAPVPMDECGLATAADLIGDRTSLLILRELFYGVGRFDDIQSDLACSRSVLSDRLKRLQAQGLVEKEAYREAGQRPRFSYILTPRAQALAVVFAALLDWGGEGLGHPAELRHRRSGRPIRAALVDGDGHIVRPQDVEVVRTSTPNSLGESGP